jgi:hypothetical protein
MLSRSVESDFDVPVCRSPASPVGALTTTARTTSCALTFILTQVDEHTRAQNFLFVRIEHLVHSTEYTVELLSCGADSPSLVARSVAFSV